MGMQTLPGVAYEVSSQSTATLKNHKRISKSYKMNLKRKWKALENMLHLPIYIESPTANHTVYDHQLFLSEDDVSNKTTEMKADELM